MPLPYALIGHIGAHAVLGLIMSQSHETLEPELASYLNASAFPVYTSRVPSGAVVTPETLRTTEADLLLAADLLPPSLDFEAIIYGCTSGATFIGPHRVASLDQNAHATTAVIAGLRALGPRRIAMVTPYVENVAEPMRGALHAEGLEVSACLSFEEASVRAPALAAGGQGGTNAVFHSCTNLLTLPMIEEAEAALGCYLAGSKQALA